MHVNFSFIAHLNDVSQQEIARVQNPCSTWIDVQVKILSLLAVCTLFVCGWAKSETNCPD